MASTSWWQGFSSHQNNAQGSRDQRPIMTKLRGYHGLICHMATIDQKTMIRNWLDQRASLIAVLALFGTSIFSTF